MLLHELPKRSVRRLRKSVTWTDIDVNWATISKDLLRSPTMWLSLYVVVAFRRAAERIIGKS